jgi:di/tricarboxylate transporter
MIPAIIILLSGIFCIVASLKDWDFFFENRKAKWIVKIFKRKGARIFYFIIGLVLMLSSIGLFLQS